MVVVDTTVWVDYLKGGHTPQTDWLDHQVGRQRLGLTNLILCEVLQGVRDDRRWREVRQILLSFKIFATGGIDLAIA